MDSKKFIPWVEKYRPINFDEIVFGEDTDIIFHNIFKNKYMPNLLLYGPPGTGKTTTIINLVNKFQEDNKICNKGLMIHLNASDERGIDTIRNQIYNFVNSKSLFVNGIKFVILDEVDYMTKNAQQALKYLLQEYRENTRFCLICNYISKIDDSLQNEFVKVKFNQLPKDKIINFLDKININENLNLSKNQLEAIQENFKSDIRSMINYIQSNQFSLQSSTVITLDIFQKIDSLLKKSNFNNFKSYISKLKTNYNIDNKTIIKKYINYLIRNESYNKSTLSNLEQIIRNIDISPYYQLELFFYLLSNES